MGLTHEIKQLCENSFDIPFHVAKDFASQEPQYEITPSGSQDHLFKLIVRFQNEISLIMTFEPQQFAADMVREMGGRAETRKKVFCSYMGELKASGAKVSLAINNVNYDPFDFTDWPLEWKMVTFRARIIPILHTADDSPDYHGTVAKWLPLMMGASLSLLNVIRVEAEEESVKGFREGHRYDVNTSRYERNPVNRVLCLAEYGYTCQICGFNFEDRYGALGKDFIHVHHVVPVSSMGDDYVVDPIHDMIPVCPNCHAMLHREDPPISPGRLKLLLR